MKTLKSVAALLMASVAADQPVHCLREQLFGHWEFHVSQDSATVNLFDT